MYVIGMFCRRKLKKIILLIFFACMIIKIHKDYQELNKVNDKDLETFFTMSNDSSHMKILTLNNIKDIMLSEKFFNKSQRNFPLNLKETITLKAEKTIDLPKTVGQATTKMKSNYLIKDDKNQIDNALNYDNRIHYNPSFKKKMEEAAHRKLENVKTLPNNSAQGKSKEVDSEIVKKEVSKPQPSTQLNGQVMENTKRTNTVKISDNINSKNNSTNSSKDNLITNTNNTKPTNLVKINDNKNNSKSNSSNSSKDNSIKNDTNISVTKKIHKMIARLKDLKKTKTIAKQKPKPKATVFKVSHAVDSAEISLNESEILRIKNETKHLNEEQHIYNEDIYGSITSDDTVIVVQVHNRLENLKYLVDSLTNCKYINTSLVIFSHDFWDQNINYFIRSISAFKVMQIYFPHSIQMNPVTFPGRDPRDCVWNQRDLNKQLPNHKKVHCLNSNWPDSFGHYREAAFTQIKHHWWWKLIQIFEKIRELQTFTGQVMFLEEDHYVVPDILHMLKLLVKERDKTYSSDYVYGLGNYQRQISGNIHLGERGDWVVNKYNLGFAFNRSIYNVIKECQNTFCNYDDYNWDWTLASIVKTCALNKLPMLSLKFSRVLHIGSCGTHSHKGNCILSKEVISAKERIKSASVKLFPKTISIQRTFKTFAKPKNTNGGWGDFRDKKLCLALVNKNNITSVLEELHYRNITLGKSAS